LRPLDDPIALSQLRNVQKLTAQERRLSDKVEQLRDELRGIERSKGDRRKRDREIASLKGQLRGLERAKKDLLRRNVEIAKLKERLQGLESPQQARRKLKSEIDKLKEQLRETSERAQYLDRQNRSLSASGEVNTFGRRPCWIANGRAVKTFDIFITDRGFNVFADWPRDFNAKARSEPAVGLLSNRRGLTVPQFRRLAGALDKRGREKNAPITPVPRTRPGPFPSTYTTPARNSSVNISTRSRPIRRIAPWRPIPAI
jgi:hypothetical protein